MNKFLFGILVLTIIIRLFLVTLPSFKIDMTSWQAWSGRLISVTPINFYAPNYFADYFPGYLYMLWFLGNLFYTLFPHLSIVSLEFEIFLKLLTNIFDLLTAYYIYKIVTNYQKKLGGLAAIFYLLNPALTFNSSIWGQVDGIVTFFMVYSSYYLLELKKCVQFSFSSALAILVKPQALAIFPVQLIYYLKNFPFQKYFYFLLIPLFLVIFSLPFFLKDPLLGLFHLFQKSTNVYPFTSMFSYNFWSLTGWWISDKNKFLNLSYQYWGIILFFVILIIILFPLFKKKNYQQNYLVYFASALSIFAFFLFLTRIHQRYLFPFFAFLLITSIIKNSLKLKVFYIFLSLIHLINLWYVYYYYNFVFDNPNFLPSPIFEFLNTNYNLFTVINLASFIILTLIYYSYSLKNVKKISKN